MWGADAVALGGRGTLDFWGYKETWGVVLLLLGTLGGIFEGLGTAKCHFRVWMSLRNSEGIFLSIGNLGFLRIAKLGESSLRSLKLPSHSETLGLAFVNIFRSRLGGLTKRECRADGGASDGGVKGKPLNKPLKH